MFILHVCLYDIIAYNNNNRVIIELIYVICNNCYTRYKILYIYIYIYIYCIVFYLDL